MRVAECSDFLSELSLTLFIDYDKSCAQIELLN